MPIWPAELCVKNSVVSLLWQPLKGPLFPPSPSWSRMSPTPCDRNPPPHHTRHSAACRTHSKSRMPPCEWEPNLFCAQRKWLMGFKFIFVNFCFSPPVPQFSLQLFCMIFQVSFNIYVYYIYGNKSYSFEYVFTVGTALHPGRVITKLSKSRGTWLLCVCPVLVRLVSSKGHGLWELLAFLFSLHVSRLLALPPSYHTLCSCSAGLSNFL